MRAWLVGVSARFPGEVGMLRDCELLEGEKLIDELESLLDAVANIATELFWCGDMSI